MKNWHYILLLLVPIPGLSQFKNTEFYAISRYSLGFGMQEVVFKQVNPTMGDTATLKILPGDGAAPEIGLGFKIQKNIYLETTIGLYINNALNPVTLNGATSMQGHTFNRFFFCFNGTYFIPISSKFLLDFKGGTSFYLPRPMEIFVDNNQYTLTYGAHLGLQGGFGGNLIFNKLMISCGLKYRIETYPLNSSIKQSASIKNPNPDFDQIKANGIDLVTTISYHF